MSTNAFYFDGLDDAHRSPGNGPANEAGQAGDRAEVGVPTRRIAPLLARLDIRSFGLILTLSPMHAIDVARRWSALCGSFAAGTVLIDDHRPEAEAQPLALSIPVAEDPAQLKSRAFEAFVDRLGLGRAVAVLVDGPVDHRDIAAMERAQLAGKSPLEGELRAEAALHVIAPRTIEIHLRRRQQAAPILAEALRHYVAAIRGVDVQSVAAPAEGLLYDLLEDGRSFEVRPAETESHSTAIDVTIRLDHDVSTMSLIYDIYANSWHGD